MGTDVPLIAPGTKAPDVPGVALGETPRALWFFKVTCPVCQMTAPVAERLAGLFPGTVAGVGQDPQPALSSFAQEYGTTFETVTDAPPFLASNAYGIEVVPTLVLVGRDGDVADVVESWDREGYKRVAAALSDLTGVPYTAPSEESDGLPPFRPG